MIVQLHEEYENSKNHLLGLCLLLLLFDSIRRQPMPRITLRRGWRLVGPGMRWAVAPGLTAPPLRSCARLNEHLASHMAGTAVLASAQCWLSQPWVDMGFARSMGRCQQGRVRVIGLEHLPRKTCQRMTRSCCPPSSRAGLFAIGEHSIPQSFVGEKMLTATGGGDHC